MILRIWVLEIIFLVLSSMEIPAHAANNNNSNNKNINKKKNRNKNKKQPNVIVIMTDEHNFRTISSYRNHLLSKYPKESVDVWGDNVFVETPNIDSLANDGVLFTNFYSPLPQCTPSRASFMTGMYPDATGASSNHQPMNEDQTTWAQILQQNGYYTGYAGKWHLDGQTIPGFDAPEGRNFGFNHTKYRYNRGHWKCFDEMENGEIKIYNDFKQCKKDFSKQDLKKHYSTDFLFQKGIDFVELATTEMQNDPFVLFLSITDPHSPNEVRPPYDKMYKHMKVNVPNTAIRKIKRDPAAPAFNHDNKNTKYDVYLEPDEIHAYIRNIDNKSKFPIENHVQKYFGMVKLLDDKLGKFIQRLKDMDVYNNSYIIFSSDHGDLLAEHGKIDKNSPYEASAKIPFILKYPNSIKGVKQIDSAYSQVDFAPTLLGLLGISYNSVEFQGADGTNEILGKMSEANSNGKWFVINADGSQEVVQSLQNTNTEHKDKIVYSYTPFRVDDDKGWIAAMKDGYKYIISNGEPVLFDLSLDPDELQNFITSSSHNIIFKQLQQALKDYLLGDNSNFFMTAYLDPPSCSNTMDVFPIYTNGDKNFISCDDIKGMNDSLCNKEKVRNKCPIACYVDCADSTGEVYHNRKISKCEDLSLHCDDDRIRSFCPKTCQTTGEVDGNSNVNSKPEEIPARYPSTSPKTSNAPSHSPTEPKSNFPSGRPSEFPSLKPSMKPSKTGTVEPSSIPSVENSSNPTTFRSGYPSVEQTFNPSNALTSTPSIPPTTTPSLARSNLPSASPSFLVTMAPSSNKPSMLPSKSATGEPSSSPSLENSNLPSSTPTIVKSSNPSMLPTNYPSLENSTAMSTEPSFIPTLKSSLEPSQKGSNSPSLLATSTPSNEITNSPSEQNTIVDPDVVDLTFVQRVCNDDSKFRFWNEEINKRVNCGYIMYHRPIDAKILREKYCLPNSKIFRRCKWSCGRCDNSIHDDPTFRFRQGQNNKFTKCKFITANSKERKNRQKNLCQKSHDGLDVKDACILSCGNFG